MERNPVHTPVVSLQNELYNGIGVSEHVRLVSIGTGHLILEGHGSRRGVLLAQTGNVPHTYTLVKRGGNDKVFFRVELRAHRVVVVAGHVAD